MGGAFVVVGSVVLVAVVVDVFATVVRPDGSGFLATTLSRHVWGLALAWHRRRPSHGVLAAWGVVAVALMPVAWMLSMWGGWTLIFHGSDDAVLVDASRRPADGWGRLYFAGFSLFTSGLGDLVPGGAPWQVATVVASAMGLGLVTLAITFLVPVVQAANDRRALARRIHQIGGSTEEILRRHHDAGRHTLATLVADVPPALTKLAIQHDSYPVLDHLHSPDVRQALMPRLATLHDACVIARSDLGGVDRVRVEAVVGAIDYFTLSLASEVPVDPDVETGTWSDGRTSRLADAAATRTRLRSLVEADGWSWEDEVVHGAGASVRQTSRRPTGRRTNS